MSKVALVRCETYDENAVQEAVDRGLALLGGAERFIHAGEQIVLKPNMLAGDAPEKLIGPHPAVFRAVITALQTTGVSLSYGDSPGFGNPFAAARRLGLAQVAEEFGVAEADFTTAEKVSFHEGHMIKQFMLAKGVIDADGLVSVAKLKSHGMTRVTGAIKNQFGCIPGTRKAEFHVRMADIDKFSQMLVDLNNCIKPRLYIMDGIIAMQGNGPRNGDPYPAHVLLFSDDPAALDATVCRIVQLDTALVPMLKYAKAYGLGDPDNVEILGDPLESFVVRQKEDFMVNRSPASTTVRMGMLEPVFKRWITSRPYIIEDKCTQCGTCVKVCPAEPKAVNWHDGKKDGEVPTYHYEDCIRCYCCQELCPFDAIEVETPLLGRVLHGRS
ncbi:MAG: DUF362 domain-containing protein [Anaerolineaceae bacterium]|nr:DUF362 domain-containing protein [Anaerolineaceae bacterium]